MTLASVTSGSATSAVPTSEPAPRATATDAGATARQSGLVQAPGRRLVLEASELESRAGFALRDGAVASDARIIARAHLPQDTLGRAGLPGPAGEMPLVIRPLPEGGGAARMLLGLAHGGEEPDFHASLWLPPEVFSALARDAEAGRAGRLRLIATTSLWLDAAERDTPAGRPVAWKLGRDGDSITPARGLVERIDWSPVAPPAALPAEPPAPVAAAEDPAETVAEAIGRLNWSLKQIALVLVFLMIIVALK